MKMRNKKFSTIVYSILLPAIFFTACGGPKAQKPAEKSNTVEVAKSDEMVEEGLAEQEENQEDSLKGESIGSVGYIEDFDIYRSYEPSEIVLSSSSLSDGMYIQIGDSVLKLGYARLSDFINAGVDLYSNKIVGDEDYGTPSRNREKNDRKLEEDLRRYQDGHVMFMGYLPADYKIDMIFAEA